MSGSASKSVNRSDEYPDHLNPFDENYGGEPEGRSSPPKYNTWGATRDRRVLPVTENKPWSASATPKSKLVRRLSLLKNTVGRLSFRRPRRNSVSGEPPATPQSAPGGDFSFTIISPKVKERIRRQVFRSPPDAAAKADTVEQCAERLKAEPLSPNSPPTSRPISPQPPPRTKPRKKRPPPPPPPTQRSYSHAADTADPTDSPKSGGSPDSRSVSSSITRDLEGDTLALSEAEEDHSFSLFITETKTKSNKKIDKAKD